MDLYISPFACSLAVHIACLEGEVPIKIQPVDGKTKLLPDGTDYRAVSPKALVPAIRLPDGELLTEAAAVLQYVADRVPAKSLAPKWGTPERYRLIEWLNFIGTELHKKHLALVFSSSAPEVAKTFAREGAAASFAHVARHLDKTKTPFLLGNDFTVADAYLFWTLLAAPYGGISLDAFPVLGKYVDRVRERAAVRSALSVELPLFVRETGSPPTLPTIATKAATASA